MPNGRRRNYINYAYLRHRIHRRSDDASINMEPIKNKLEEIKKELETESREYNIISLGSLHEMEFPENAWAIRNMIPLEGITIVSGAPSSFKTWITFLMAIAIAKGEKFLGLFESTQSKILIIDEENHLREVKRRMERMDKNGDLPIFFLSQEGFLVRDISAQKKVLKICQDKGIAMVFIDSLVRVNNADENVATEMSAFFRELKKFCKAGITVVLIHHERKEGLSKGAIGSRLRGSSDILAAVDSHISIRKSKDDKNILTVEQSKLRCDKEFDPFDISVRDTEDETFFEYLGERPKELSKQQSAKAIILSALEESSTDLAIKTIVEAVRGEEQVGDKTVRIALKELIKAGDVLEKSSGVKNEKICYLPTPSA